MADSNLTKRALANALQELMIEIPFERISVSQICEKCDMNRKSFYYHFKDKYDLVNWIFDMDFIAVFADENFNNMSSNEERWKTIDIFLQLFYKNKTFYQNALKIKGQNSFSEHFYECIRPIIKKRIETTIDNSASETFTIDFFSDACICALERWLSEKDSMPPEQFSALLKKYIQMFSTSIYNESKQNQDGIAK